MWLQLIWIANGIKRKKKNLVYIEYLELYSICIAGVCWYCCGDFLSYKYYKKMKEIFFLLFQTFFVTNLVMTISRIDITFFAKHSGSIPGDNTSLNEFVHHVILSCLSKRHLSRVMKLNPLGRWNCVISPICQYHALRKFDIDKICSKGHVALKATTP